MNYLHFNEEDFAADDFFQQWVLEEHADSDSFWLNWIKEHPEKQDTIKKARWLVKNISFRETWTQEEWRAMWQTIEAKLGQEDDQHGSVVPLWQQTASSGHWWKANKWIAAASIALVVIGAGLLYKTQGANEIRTGYGEIRRITLADGSSVTLNANSTLSYSKHLLDNREREVWIEGEAFFDVVKYAVKGQRIPFVVHANKLSIQVLGTAFNVSNRREKIDVALEHGSVKVVDEQDEKNSILLSPGERVSQANQKAQLVKQTVQIETYTSWKEHVIQYRHKSLGEIAEMMKDLYNLDVIIDNPALRNETFTGSFPADSAEVFFDKLKRMVPVDIQKEGNVIHVK